MTDKRTWQAFQRRLEAGFVLRHVAGLSHPVAVARDCPFHEHEAIELVFHVTGQGMTAVDGGGQVAFSAGDVVLYGAGVRHDQRMTEDGVDCCVQVGVPEGPGPTGHLHVGAPDDVVLRSELEYLSSRSPGGSAVGDALLNLRTTAVMLQLIGMAFSKADPEEERLERHVLAAERFMQEHYASIRSVEEIAAAAEVGPDHLRHVFRKRRGKSLVGHLAEVRLSRARTLLAHANLPIKEIAGLCGYCNEYYFSTVFKRRYGCAPGHYRERTARG